MSFPLNVLFVSGSGNILPAVERELRRGGYEPFVEKLESPRDLRRASSGKEWHVIIEELVAGSENVSQTLETLKQSGWDVPFFVLCDELNQEGQIGMIRSGVDDVIAKKDISRLGLAVERGLREKEERRKRWRAEDSVQKSEERYRDLIESLREGIWVLDQAGHATFVNRCAADMLGYEPGDMLGKSLSNFMEKEGTDDWLKDFGDKPAAGRDWEQRIVKKDGTLLTVLVRASPLFDRHENRIGTLVGVLDITERRRAEEALNRREAELRQSQKMEALGRLSGAVAHDFNNILTVIMGYSNILLRTMENDERRENVTEIKSAGARAAALTQQMLAFSRQQILQPRVLDLNEIVSRLEKMLNRLIGEDIRLKLALSPGLPGVKVDPIQMEQVVMNLSVNARDAMPMGGELVIETSAVHFDEDRTAQSGTAAKAGRYVCLAVSDSGVGMTDDVKNHLFEPFFTTKEMGRGTGFGLSTVFGIVQQSGGCIDVDSQPGRGSRFAVYLPAQDQPKAEEGAATAAREGLFSGGRERILLVEDDEPVRRVIQRTLEQARYEVLPAGGPNEAMAVIQEVRGDVSLVLTDVVMPGMYGPQLVAELTKEYPGLRVIYMSAHMEHMALKPCTLETGVPFLQKPFTPEELLDKIKQTLGAKKGESR